MAEQTRSFLKLNLAPHGPLATKSDATCCATSVQRREHHPHKTKRSTCTLVKMTKPIKKSRFFASDMGSLREQERNKVVLKPRSSEPQTLKNPCNLTHRYAARKLQKNTTVKWQAETTTSREALALRHIRVETDTEHNRPLSSPEPQTRLHTAPSMSVTRSLVEVEVTCMLSHIRLPQFSV